jgi:hypothetical protein
MVVPKTSTLTQIVNVYTYQVCDNSLFNIEIGCVEPLPTFEASDRVDSPDEPGYCALSPTANTFYVAKVSNSLPYPILNINDWVFQDENGENKLLDGYYKTNNVVVGDDTIEVVNGVIVAITNECP